MLHILTPPTPCHAGMIQFPPPLNVAPIIPPAVCSTNEGMEFCQSGSRSDPNVSTDHTSNLWNDSRTITMINGCLVNG